jgi:predicted Zn finger-like uncharacterized protein
MSLTTRCPNCKTIFQFPPALISESGGWAKCKRCHEVFNAAAYLIHQNLEQSQVRRPQDIAPVNARPSVKSNAAQQPSRTDKKTKPRIEPSGFTLEPLEPPVVANPLPSAQNKPAKRVTPLKNQQPEPKFVPSQPPFGSGRETLAGRESRRPATAASASSAQKPRTPGAIPRTEGRLSNTANISGVSSAGALESKRRATTGSAVAIRTESPTSSNSASSTSTRPNSKEGVAIDTVSIIDPVQQAKRSKQEFIRNKQFLWVGSILAIVMLFLQITLSERNRLATHFPATKSLLQPLCQLFSCNIEPLKLMEAVAIENSSFHISGPEQVGTVEEQYQLTWSVSNKALHEVAIPNLELTLNDVLDRPLLRRVLSPQDLGFSQKTITAEGVWEGSTIITVIPPEGGGQVSGYRLTVFYP